MKATSLHCRTGTPAGSTRKVFSPQQTKHFSGVALFRSRVEYLLIASGAWLIHPVMIISLKILFNSLPGVSQELSWTLTNLTYMASSYLMFHWVKGIPFEFNAGAYDNLNMWEQMDNGDQYTPAKKYLTFVPIVLYVSFGLSSGGSAAYENDMLTCQVSTEHTLLSL